MKMSFLKAIISKKDYILVTYLLHLLHNSEDLSWEAYISHKSHVTVAIIYMVSPKNLCVKRLTNYTE